MFGPAAFLISAAIRAVPEIIVGPYPVGFDTIAFYVPNTLDLAAGKLGFWQSLGLAPLMYVLSVSAYLFLRINPVWIFKIMGPVFYGGMIWSLFRFLRSALLWSNRHALGGALFTALYFVTLRVGWDMYRNVLGLAFILLGLPLIRETSIKKQLLLSVFILLAVAADQLTGILVLATLGLTALFRLSRGKIQDFLRIVRVAVPGTVLFFLTVYADVAVSGGTLVKQQPVVPAVDTFASSVGFLGYVYAPILPLVILGAPCVKSAPLKLWSAFCTALVLTAVLPFLGLIVASYRWSLLLDVPICIYAIAGLERLGHPLGTGLVWLGQSRRWIAPAFSTVLIASTLLYVALPAQQAMIYYTAFPSLLPTSMVQNTVPLSDMNSLMSILAWAATQVGPKTALITHQAIYGWARAYLPSLSSYVINYGYASPLDGVGVAQSAGYSCVVLVWWVSGLGWHGQPDVPTGFIPIRTDGNMAVYRYC